MRPARHARPLRLLAVVLAVAGVLALLEHHHRIAHHDAQRVSAPVPRPTAPPARAPSPLSLADNSGRVASPAAIDRQDHVSRAHEKREARAFDQRPLLAQLPLTYHGVRIDIAGLAADGRTTRLAVTATPDATGTPRAVYQEALRAFGDTGGAYLPRFRG